MRILRRNSSESLRKYFRFQKMLDGQRPHNFESKIAIRSKTHRKEGRSPDTKKKKRNKEKKKQGRKINIAFRDTLPALSVHYIRSFNEKVESYASQPLLCQIFKEPPIISLRKEKNYGKGHACYSQHILIFWL